MQFPLFEWAWERAEEETLVIHMTSTYSRSRGGTGDRGLNATDQSLPSEPAGLLGGVLCA